MRASDPIPNPNPVLTDSEGRALVLQLAAGSHNCSVSATGFAPFTDVVLIATGTVKRLTVPLTPLP